MMEEKTKVNRRERLEIKKKILKFLLNFDEKDILYKVNELHNIEDKLAKSIIDEVWHDVNSVYNKDYCVCPRPDRESGFSYCAKCHKNVSGERIEDAVMLQEQFWELVKESDHDWLKANERICKIIYSMLDFIPIRKDSVKETPQDENLLGTIYDIFITVDKNMLDTDNNIVDRNGNVVITFEEDE